MLALAYLVVISLVVAMLSTWVSNDLNNSTKFSSSNALTVAASGMTDMAIQYVRYNPIISNSQAVAPAVSPLVACWGGTNISEIPAIDGDQVAVWCTTEWNPLVAQTRTVTFYACPISVLAGACENSAFLTAIVIYDDYPPAPARSAPIQDLCTVFCGQGMTIQSWQWGSASGGSATGVAASLSFTNEPSDTTAFASTQASVLVLDSGNNPVVDDTVTLVQQSGPSNGAVPGISSPTSVLTAYTNSAGVATFNSIYPQIAGNYTLTAVDGSAVATSTNFVVGLQRSVISPPPAPYEPDGEWDLHPDGDRDLRRLGDHQRLDVVSVLIEWRHAHVQDCGHVHGRLHRSRDREYGLFAGTAGDLEFHRRRTGGGTGRYRTQHGDPERELVAE